MDQNLQYPRNEAAMLGGTGPHERPRSAVSTTVAVVLERRGGQWRAAPLFDSRRVVVGHNSKTARRLISQRIQEQLGSAVRITFQILLPDKQRALLREFIEESSRCAPGNSVPPSRVSCARQLLALHLTQEEVAELMGISRGLLAVTLHRADAAQGMRRRGTRAP